MKPVTIYSTPTCHYCNMAKEYFAANNVSYQEYNVASDGDRRKEMMEISGQLGVPVIVVDHDVVIGFNKAKLMQLLGLADLPPVTQTVA